MALVKQVSPLNCPFSKNWIIMTNRNSDALNEQILENLTEEQLQELKDLYVERMVDNMSTKDLVRYVFDDMTDYVDKQSPVEFFDDAYSYFDDYFDELVEEIKGGQSVNDLDGAN